MKILLHNRKDVLVLQNSQPLKVYCEKGVEYVLPAVNEDGSYEVEFVKSSEFTGKAWFGRAALFWVVGIFGIFTPRYSKCVHSFNCKARGIDNGETIDVSFAHPTTKATAIKGVAVRQEGIVLEGDSYVVDEVAYKRKKLCVVLSRLLRLGAVAGIAYFVIKALLGF